MSELVCVCMCVRACVCACESVCMSPPRIQEPSSPSSCSFQAGRCGVDSDRCDVVEIVMKTFGLGGVGIGWRVVGCGVRLGVGNGMLTSICSFSREVL